MEKEKALKRYIAPNIILQIAAILMVVAFLISCCMLAATIKSTNAVDEMFEPWDTKNHTMAYLDVVGVSNWLYQPEEYCRYYSALDAEGNLYTVYLTDGILRKMTAQQDYWMDEDAPIEVYRLEGYVQKLPEKAREELAQCWDVTEEEYSQYFGEKYLDTTTSAKEQTMWLWILAALFSSLFGLLLLVLWLPAAKAYKVCCRDLEKRGLLERAAQQFDQLEDGMVCGKNRAVLTKDFLFGKGSGMAVPYSDIVWAYGENLIVNYGWFSTSVFVATASLKPRLVAFFGGKDKDTGIAESMLDTIREKNPRAMTGASKTSKEAYKEIYKAAKSHLE